MIHLKPLPWLIAGCLAAGYLLMTVFWTVGAWEQQSQPLSFSFVVNDAGDAPDFTLDGICDTGLGTGICTLRAAIQEANNTPGLDVIEFGGMPVADNEISPITPLPTIVDPVSIRGFTHPQGIVGIRGHVAGFGNGLHIQSGGSELVLLAIYGWEGHGIWLEQNGSTVISDCLIGFDIDTAANGNGADGIFIDGVASNIIEGSRIGNNGQNGVHIVGSTATTNTIRGTYIGTDALGMTANGNNRNGVLIEAAAYNVIGDLIGFSPNVIAGNFANGIEIYGTTAVSNTIIYTHIGTDLAGSNAVANQGNGVNLIEASYTTIGRPNLGNVIAGNQANGILITGTNALHNRIQANKVGTDLSGSIGLFNQGDGIYVHAKHTLIGGDNAVGEGNLISGNQGDGIKLDGPDGFLIVAGTEVEHNIIQGNRIGTDATGTADLGNWGYGIRLIQANSNTIGGTLNGLRNLVSGNGQDGVHIHGQFATQNRVMGNFIGTDVSGTATIRNGLAGVYIFGAPNNEIGTANLGNLISGNPYGIIVYETTAVSNTISTNFIGTDVNGTADLGNWEHGIYLADVQYTMIDGNLISGQDKHGIFIQGPQTIANTVQGNMIGTNIYGTTSLSNTGHGIYIDQAAYNQIGGPDNGDSNLISGNLGHGVLISQTSANHNKVQGNQIGVAIDGMSPLGNGLDGISVLQAPANLIGGTDANTGNLISANSGMGVSIEGVSAVSNTVQGNRIGTTADGLSPLGNGGNGVRVEETSLTIIGGTDSGAGNLISGNGLHGVFITDWLATGNSIAGNTIGLNILGTAVLPNGQSGIYLRNGYANIIGGGKQAGNLISGNGTSGIILEGFNTWQNEVTGNRIGTDATGTIPLGNADNGVTIIDAPYNTIGRSGAGNLISGNKRHGIEITGTLFAQAIVQGNFIGTNISGTTAVSNTLDGISVHNTGSHLLGGTLSGDGNVIAGNGRHGIYLTGTRTIYTQIQGNFVGTNSRGADAIPNQGNGIQLNDTVTVTVGGIVSGAGNLISGNGNYGLAVDTTAAMTTGLTIQGNKIGTNVTGTVAVPNGRSGVYMHGAQGDLIGGMDTNARNLISGNNEYGIHLWSVSAIDIQNNYIGTNISGTAVVGNQQAGIYTSAAAYITIGGQQHSTGNLISGNGGQGIIVNGPHFAIQGNLIGVDVSGQDDLGNNYAGIQLSENSNFAQIGSSSDVDLLAQNIIAYNSTGIYLGGLGTPGFQNSIRRNSIYSNSMGLGATGLGVDLYAPSGPTVTPNDLNDTDAGWNELQNYPVLQTASSDANSIVITGTLNSGSSSTFAVDFYSNQQCNPLGYGEGERYLGTQTVNTNSSGNASFVVTLPQTVYADHQITAVATDSAGNSSEFSACISNTCQALPPVTPTNVLLTPTMNSTLLTWSANPVNQLYEGWRSTQPYFTPLVSGSMRYAGTTAVFTDSYTSGQTLYYVIISRNACGQTAGTTSLSIQNRVGRFVFFLSPGN